MPNTFNRHGTILFVCSYNSIPPAMMKGPHNKIFLAFLLLFVCLVSALDPRGARAEEAEIRDVLITNTTEQVLVYFRVTDCFTEEMEEAIHAGIPTTFTFTIELHRKRGFWWDKLEFAREIKHTIKYDNVKKLFYVAFTEDGKRPEQFTDFAKAKTAMSDVNGVAIMPLRNMIRGSTYYLRAKAELEAVKLPLHLEYVFFFVSLWDFETEWITKEFVY